jgi:hypothetical protein
MTYITIHNLYMIYVDVTFQNAGKVNWSNISEALPVFIMAIFVPFTYSIFNGVIFGFSVHLILLLCTGTGSATKRLRTWRRKLVPTAIAKHMRHIRSWASWGEGGSGANNGEDDGGDGLYSRLNTADTVTVTLYDPNSTGSNAGQKDPSASGGMGQWNTYVDASSHKPAVFTHSNRNSDDEDSSDEDDDAEEKGDSADAKKMLSFSLSAIGDEITDADTTGINPMINNKQKKTKAKRQIMQMNSKDQDHQPKGRSWSRQDNSSAGGVIDLEANAEPGNNSTGKEHLEYSSFDELRKGPTTVSSASSASSPSSGPWGRRNPNTHSNSHSSSSSHERSVLNVDEDDIEVVL